MTETRKFVIYGLLAVVVIGIGIWRTSKEAAHDRERAALFHARCSPLTPEPCMDTAKQSLRFGSYAAAVEEYETACNASYEPACVAADLLCETGVKEACFARVDGGPKP